MTFLYEGQHAITARSSVVGTGRQIDNRTQMERLAFAVVLCAAEFAHN